MRVRWDAVVRVELSFSWCAGFFSPVCTYLCWGWISHEIIHMAANGIFGKCGDKLAQTSEGRTFRWGLRQDASQALFVVGYRRCQHVGGLAFLGARERMPLWLMECFGVKSAAISCLLFLETVLFKYPLFWNPWGFLPRNCELHNVGWMQMVQRKPPWWGMLRWGLWQEGKGTKFQAHLAG